MAHSIAMTTNTIEGMVTAAEFVVDCTVDDGAVVGGAVAAAGGGASNANQSYSYSSS